MYTSSYITFKLIVEMSVDKVIMLYKMKKVNSFLNAYKNSDLPTLRIAFKRPTNILNKFHEIE